MQIHTNLGITHRLLVNFFIGIAVGVIGSIVRIGWEMLYPVNLESNLGEHAQMILGLIGINSETLQTKYVFANGYEWHIMYIVWQFCFSLAFAMLYVIAAEFWLPLKFGCGIIYGFALWICVYILFLPMFGFISERILNSYVYYASSLMESILWICIIEFIRRDIRNRITSELDPI